MDTEPKREIKDCEALNRIAELLDGQEWDSETLDNVAHAVRATGREIRDPNDMPEDEGPEAA